MRLSLPARRFIAGANARGLPCALWRRPDGDRFEAMIGAAAMTPGTVLSAAPRPGFAMSRFDEPVAGVADMLAADVVIDGDAVRFVDADGGLQLEPATAAQQALAAAVEGTGDVPAVTAGTSATPPAVTSETAYHALVDAAVGAIHAGRFTKVVTSRAEPRPLPAGQDLLSLAERLAARYPAAFVALVLRPGQDAWLVATPETLLRLRDGRLYTMALAGTQAQPAEVDLRRVTWTDKFIEEQALVARYIRRAFADCGIDGVEESGPRTVRAANLVHLRSEFAAPLPADQPEAAAALLAALHPTSAVCGLPKAPAIDFLRAHEGYDRACYTGFLGPVGLTSGSDLYVNLRTSQIIGDTIYLYVGGGIVDGSDPAAEWQETVDKTRTIGAVLAGD